MLKYLWLVTVVKLVSCHSQYSWILLLGSLDHGRDTLVSASPSGTLIYHLIWWLDVQSVSTLGCGGSKQLYYNSLLL